MSDLLKELNFDDIDFQVCSSQQFATVLFDRREDSEETLITIFKDDKIKQMDGDNRYNPSSRRHSSCVYVTEEWQDGKTIKICTIQHKGTTLVKIYGVSEQELSYLFGS
ncbi:short-chain dehydrogenase [Candidatus Thiodictyon syntrophicum]|jgi:hypothetical protein|uniref:Short-chain dehydrogenase n=1 Tax=Candidatus Thiodictyon syntrophicum TaxID=1166950 RepID=A0A2K8U2K9_9GAMM|nr:short-chain dehydrogenase [Candidatus Thiodictyon syntrophicum]AUB79820.1 short-chain dehydrogenase [Candidatus Thiodictyon syntrophicum]